MRKQPSSINRILNKCKDYLISVLIFILFLCFLLLFKCKSRYGYRKERQEKREAAITTSMIKAIESDKNPVYTIHGKNKTLELPMEVTDKGKLVSVVWNGHKTGFELSDEESEFTVSPQGILAWYESGLLTAEEMGGEETISKLEENIKNLSSVTTMLDAGKTPEGMLEVLLSGMDLEITDTLPVEFACNCSKDRVRKALISIGREELQSMIDDGETIEVNCHFCNKNYNFTVDELKQMIQ